VKRKPENILQHEIIGLRAEVFWSRNPCQVGIRGLVVDETMNTVTLRTERGDKKIIKDQVKLLLELPDGLKVLVDGRELRGRPEERLKKRVRRW